MIDIHCHLYTDKHNENSLIQINQNTNLKIILNGAENLDTSIKNKILADKYDKFYFTIGFHPHNSKEFKNNDLKTFENLAIHKKCLAIGEIGLDFFYEFSEKNIQKKVFIKQLEFSKKKKMPVILHSRAAEIELFEILKDFDPNIKGILHCYTGELNLFKKIINTFPNLYFSFGGMLTFKNTDNIRKLFSVCPIERIFLETDAPYLAPVPKRGKTNTPEFITYIYDYAANLKKISNEKLISIIENNFKNLFQKFSG